MNLCQQARGFWKIQLHPKKLSEMLLFEQIEIQPLLSRFVDHLLTVEGSCRGQK
jgi:hypothetical protein